MWLAAGVAEGQKAEIEFVVLDAGQQLWAILQGIQLYSMRRSGLVRIHAWRIGDPKFEIRYPQHRCDIKWPVVYGPIPDRKNNPIPPY